ncbi:uncharacterized protein cubi_01415 [Cryptosporidium ubiquitum]|uniref:Uncharacterized protein n=1 Tax=Cryptosporidium ubiquitum TaxID=857276 RepID=A0A1J4MCW9_9CRYT|nr:uncharacterized protein cubi_01415 [Cryptosporidium ubiquitum]OII72082.1 hypothetical protein cubi_01415 [Cryptosporidium ubiquitum]
MPNFQTPIRNVELKERKRISYSLSNNRKQNLQKLINERSNLEKNEAINKLGGVLKATSIESQIVCLERDQLVDLILVACADYPEFCKKIHCHLLKIFISSIFQHITKVIHKLFIIYI